MKVIEAAKLVTDGQLSTTILWTIATTPERVAIALILGRTDELPAGANTPSLAWNALNQQQRGLVLRHAPAEIRARLPDDVAHPTQHYRQRPPGPGAAPPPAD